MDGEATATYAISCALKQDWEEAIQINKKLLKRNDQDIDALNRLGFAYMKAGDVKKAKSTFKKVIALDQYNMIALKNLNKLDDAKSEDVSASSNAYMSPSAFLQDPGRTKILACVKLAPISVLSTIQSGQIVFLKDRKRGIEIRDARNTYIAALPDDMSFRLQKFISAGNTYEASIKTVNKTTLTVFIREITRGKRFAGQPSFLASAMMPAAAKKRTRKTKTT